MKGGGINKRRTETVKNCATTVRSKTCGFSIDEILKSSQKGKTNV